MTQLTVDRSCNQLTSREASLPKSEFFNVNEILSFMSLSRGFGFTVTTLTPVWVCPALFSPDICLFHLQVLQYIQELKCYFNQSWKKITEQFITELINLRNYCFRSHSWVFVFTRWPSHDNKPRWNCIELTFYFTCPILNSPGR